MHPPKLVGTARSLLQIVGTLHPRVAAPSATPTRRIMSLVVVLETPGLACIMNHYYVIRFVRDSTQNGFIAITRETRRFKGQRMSSGRRTFRGGNNPVEGLGERLRRTGAGDFKSTIAFLRERLRLPAGSDDCPPALHPWLLSSSLSSSSQKPRSSREELVSLPR